MLEFIYPVKHFVQYVCFIVDRDTSHTIDWGKQYPKNVTLGGETEASACVILGFCAT